ncbi:conserved hypothetical protein [Leishmania infantum JPCM5]|uniref:Uncharacterized protein n=2 Tax=Leishmania infantum TaxID=5671 RepID=A4IDI5_LEIIN|nr:conserved hypothetical protein [Leishmania infantum JPCM5]CAC9550156.1 hypothetical_protein_-_conserved [Leishmania infantum]CAM72916.1 conserved hypothetical protein [Leishmania infantum JPCM5]SUZ46597.1 hypothetical_protein_-_conserved [Leishmania infantum]|eukprot:XP_001469804.1 conserved hypothetical protein [Leishmania infantum JPCM5]
MPLSPLIRPMSPLQTQCAPSLPEPYSLADVVLQPFSGEASSTPAAAWDQDTSFGAATGDIAPGSRRSSPAAPLSGVDAASVPPMAMWTPALPPLLPHTLAPTFHSMVGDALSVEMLRESYAAQLQKGCQHRSAVEGLRCTSDGAAARARSCRGSDAGAAKVFSANDAVHLGHSRRAPLPSLALFSPIHPYASGPTARTSVAPKTSAEGPSSAATSLSLLHSAATTAMAAARPSYGAALLRKHPPAQPTGCREGCRSHLPAQKQVQRSSSQSLFERRAHDRWEVVSPTSPLSSCGGASTAAESGETAPSKPNTAVPFTASATCYRSTAASDCTGRSRAISIAAPPVAGRGGEAAAVNTPAGGGARVSNPGVVSALGPAKVEAFVAPPCHAPGSACGSGEVRDTFFDPPHGLSRKALQTIQPGPATEPARQPAAQKQGKTARGTAPTTRSSGGAASGPAAGSAASLAAESHLPRYVYPALEECRRLLHEIRIVSPLMRRCLTPPRPLESSAGGGSGAATAAAASSTFSSARAPSRNIPAPPHSSAFPSLAAAATAAAPPKPATLAPKPEARRLYHWDAATAAEDLSFMRGPFQQSSERFATSVDCQLRRLKALGTRLYGKTHDTSTSQAEVHAPARGRWSSPSPAPLASPWDSAVPRFDDDQCDREDNSVEESPPERLRRLLWETEAALPSLLEHEAEPSLSATRAAVLLAPFPSTIRYARDSRNDYSHGADDGAATGRAAGVFTPPMESLLPFSSVSGSLTPARPAMLSSLSYGE